MDGTLAVAWVMSGNVYRIYTLRVVGLDVRQGCGFAERGRYCNRGHIGGVNNYPLGASMYVEVLSFLYYSKYGMYDRHGSLETLWLHDRRRDGHKLPIFL